MKDRIKAAWPFALIGLLAVGLVLQTLRIEGLRFGHVKVFHADFWLVNVAGFKPALDGQEELQACAGELRDRARRDHRSADRGWPVAGRHQRRRGAALCRERRKERYRPCR